MAIICTTCSLQGAAKAEAKYVATAASKMQWFECEYHESWEHAAVMGEQDDPMQNRCSMVLLDVWLNENRPTGLDKRT